MSRVRCAFTSASTMSPAMRPVSLPSTISSVFDTVASSFSRACRRSVKKVNPPETSSVLRTDAPKPAKHSLGAGRKTQATVVDVLQALAARPFSSATRVRQALAEVDLAAHRALGDRGDLRLDPEHAAISSMHSMVISVESMSIATTRTRSSRWSAGTTAQSTAASRASSSMPSPPLAGGRQAEYLVRVA